MVVILARSLGPEEFGIYSYALSIMTVLAIPAQVGLPQLLIRETSRLNAVLNWSLLKGLWKTATIIVILLSTLIAVATFIFMVYVDVKYKDVILLSVLVSPFIALGNLRGAALQGLNHVLMGQIPESIIRPFLIVLLSAMLWFVLPGEVNAQNAMLVYGLSAVLTFIYGGVLLNRLKPKELKFNGINYRVKFWLSSAAPLALVASTQLIISQTDIIMLTNYASAEETGTYKVISSLCTLVIFAFMSIQTVVSPRIAKLYMEGNKLELQKLLTLAARINSILGLFIVLLLIFFGDWLLISLFGESFSNGYSALIVLALGRLVNASLGLSVPLLNMSGNERLTLQVMFFAAFLNLTLNYFLIPEFGIDGAVYGTVITMVTWNVWLWLLVKMKMKLNTSFY